jgi:DNA polymerase (family 10)
MGNRFKDLADALDEISLHYDLQDMSHVSRQYQKASRELRKADFIPPDPSEIDHIGDAVRDDIAEWRAFGEISRLESMRAERPYLSNLTKIEKVGPTTAQSIYNEKGAVSVEDVRELAENDELEDVSGIGPKTATVIEEDIGIHE